MSEERLSWEPWAAAIAVLFAVAMSVLDWSLWHSGVNHYDESANAVLLQLAREGTALPMLAFKGSLYRYAMYFYSSLFGFNLPVLHACILTFFIAENILLARFTESLFGRRAACWAVMVNALCAFSMVRARSLLSYSVVPAELMVFLLLLPSARRPWAAFLWSMAALLMILDYEVWLLGAPMLVLVFLIKHPELKSRAWVLLGAAAGTALLIFLSRSDLRDHFHLRALSTASGAGSTLFENLRGGLHSFWFGDFQFSFLGASGHAAFPPWALPGLALGCVVALRRYRVGLAWVLLSFIPLVSRGSSVEPQRAILALPMLCVLAGIGFSALSLRFSGARANAILMLLFICGASFEARAFYFGRDPYDIATYGQWRQNIEAVKAAEGLAQGGAVLTDLGRDSGAAQRFFMKSAGTAMGDTVVALIPAGMQKAASQLEGRLIPISISAKLAPTYIFVARGKSAARLKAVEASLRPFLSSTFILGPLRRREAAYAWLDANRGADPWARTAVWEAVMNASAQMHELPFGRIQQALGEPLLGSYFYLELAERLMDSAPSQSLILAKTGLLREPESAAGLKLVDEAKRRLNLASNEVR